MAAPSDNRPVDRVPPVLNSSPLPGPSPASAASTHQSNMAIVRSGTDGEVKIKNTSAADSSRVVLDVQGYFTNSQNLPAAVGVNRWRAVRVPVR